MKSLLYLGMNNLSSSNEELQLCNYLVSIPTDDGYTSLNLASAVQIFSYEYFKNTNIKSKEYLTQNPNFASHSTKSHIIQTFLNIMTELGILNDKNKKIAYSKYTHYFQKIIIHDIFIMSIYS